MLPEFREARQAVRRQSWLLWSVQIRQAARRMFDLPRFGTGPVGRLCTVLILTVLFVLAVLGVSATAKLGRDYGLTLAGAALVSVLSTCAVLVLWTPDDEMLEVERRRLRDELVGLREREKELAQVQALEDARRKEEANLREAKRRQEEAQRRDEAERERAEREARRPRTKRCPFCREVILVRALKCRYCGEILDEELARERETERPTPQRPRDDRRPTEQPMSASGRSQLIAGGVLLCSVFLCCGGLTFLGWNASEQDKARLAEANSQWESGQKADAVVAYKAFIEQGSRRFPRDADRPVIYRRVIEYELERGNTDTAKAWAEKAFDNKVEVTADSKAVTEFVAQVRADRARREAGERAQQEAEEKRQEEERQAREKQRQEEREASAKRREEEANRRREAQEARDRLLGQWACISEISGGEPITPRYHRRWSITDDRVTINGDRELRYSVDVNASPPQLNIYNQVGGRKVPLYACIYKFEGDKLIVCYNAGDDPPKDFRTGKDNVSFLNTFTK